MWSLIFSPSSLEKKSPRVVWGVFLQTVRTLVINAGTLLFISRWTQAGASPERIPAASWEPHRAGYVSPPARRLQNKQPSIFQKGTRQSLINRARGRSRTLTTWNPPGRQGSVYSLHSAAADLAAGAHTAFDLAARHGSISRGAASQATAGCWMLLKGQCYTRQQVNGLSHIFTPALRRASRRAGGGFYWVVYTERRGFWVPYRNLLRWLRPISKSYVLVLGVVVFVFFYHTHTHARPPTDCIIKPEKGIIYGPHPHRAIFFRVWPRVKRRIRAFISEIPVVSEWSWRCKMSRLKLDNKIQCLWHLAFRKPSASQSRCTGRLLPVDSCFVFGGHTGTLTFVLDAKVVSFAGPSTSLGL